MSYPQQYPAPGPAAVVPSGSGGLRGRLIKWLGGQTPDAPPAPQPHPQAAPYPQGVPYPQAAPYPPGYGPQPAAPWQQPPPAPGWPGQASYAPPGFPPSGAPGAQKPEPPASPGGSAGDNDDGKTVYMGGIDIDKFKFPKYSYLLEILDKDGQWRVWEPIRANGLNVGRKQTSSNFPALGSMASRHLKLSYQGSGVQAEDLGALNGVYRRIAEPVELKDGTRFRIGNQVIEFHPGGLFQPVPPTQASDGEEFWSRDVEPLGFLDLIRPNDQPGLRFPITKPDQTVIGREGHGVDIALARDQLASAPHARVRLENGTFYLEDMNSRNGTYVQLPGTSLLKSGDVLLVGRVLLRVVESASGG